MTPSTRIVLSLVVLLLAACAERASAPSLPDGVYEVLAVAASADALPAEMEGTRTLPFDDRFTKGGPKGEVQYVRLRATGFAPLDLARPPETTDEGGAARLLLQLKPEAGAALERLTSHAERAAIVIGGEIVTVHRIRVPIEGGGLQVSC